MDLSYCNGHKRYDFSTDERLYYPGCDPKYYHIKDVDPKAFRRGYVAALFTGNKRWQRCIEKYHLIVTGNPSNPKVRAWDRLEKEMLRCQIDADTLDLRKAFYDHWRDAAGCMDNCNQYCATCSNKTIKFDTTPTLKLDPDVRRYITRWGYKMASEEVSDGNTVSRGIRNRRNHNGAVQPKRAFGSELRDQQQKIAGNKYQRLKTKRRPGDETMLSSPIN